jgi:hypothetical protein
MSAPSVLLATSATTVAVATAQSAAPAKAPSPSARISAAVPAGAPVAAAAVGVSALAPGAGAGGKEAAEKADAMKQKLQSDLRGAVKDLSYCINGLDSAEATVNAAIMGDRKSVV